MALYSIWYSIPYIFVFLLYLMSSLKLLPDGCKNRRDSSIYGFRIFSFVFVVYLSVYFIGMRGYIFTDWISYKKIFEQSPNLLDESISGYIKTSPFEKGFILYMVILKTICRTYENYQIIDYLVNFILLLFFLKKYSSNIILSVSFYFVFFGLMMDVNLARNAKAILIFLNSIVYIEKRSFIKYLLCILIALQFHISAILYLPLYFLYPREFNKKFVLVVYIILNFFYLAKIDLLSEVLILLSNTIVQGRFGILLNRYVTNKIGFISTGITIGYIERLFTFCIVFYKYDELKAKRRNNIFFCNTLYLYCFLSLFFASNLILFERVVPLFIFAYWILFPEIYQMISGKKRNLFLVIFVIYSVLKIIATYKSYLCYYDNLLFLKLSSDQRLELFMKNKDL